MAILPILITSTPSLKYEVEQVTNFDKVKSFIGNMADILYSNVNGIGLYTSNRLLNFSREM